MQAGDIVRLKSGGPAMTVERSADRGSWVCVWWVQKDESYASRTFTEAVLEPHKAPSF